jgi:MOSC domain-containing protein YiiM
MNGMVVAVASDGAHRFSKGVCAAITLLDGLGVAGDAHCGVTVRHRSRVRADPTAPNLRQVHLMHTELFEELRGQGFDVAPGDLGENVATRGIDLLALPRGALLQLGPDAVVEVTGLRNPCNQIEQFQKGLLAAVLCRDAQGGLVRKSGIMGVVRVGGVVQPGDAIQVELPPAPHHRLDRV